MKVIRNTDIHSSHQRLVEKLSDLLRQIPQVTLKELCRNGICPVHAAYAYQKLSCK